VAALRSAVRLRNKVPIVMAMAQTMIRLQNGFSATRGIWSATYGAFELRKCNPRNSTPRLGEPYIVSNRH
jgi:hypothetical protein